MEVLRIVKHSVPIKEEMTSFIWQGYTGGETSGGVTETVIFKTGSEQYAMISHFQETGTNEATVYQITQS